MNKPVNLPAPRRVRYRLEVDQLADGRVVRKGVFRETWNSALHAFQSDGCSLNEIRRVIATLEEEAKSKKQLWNAPRRKSL